MQIKELRKKNIENLKIDLLNLLRKQFNLQIQSATNQLQQTHILKQMRRDIARINTILTEKYGDK